MTLASWFAFTHPRYRGRLAVFIALSASLAVLTYAENAALAALARSFEPARASDSAPPAAFLAAFVAARLAQVAAIYGGLRVRASLLAIAWEDLERELMKNLLAKEDAFFADHPVAEVLARVEKDVARVANRRTLVVQALTSGFFIAGNIVFFLRHDWRFALIAIAACAAGALVVHRLLPRVSELDREFLGRDDRVRGRIGDLLHAAPEIQTGNLGRAVIRGLRALQLDRAGAYSRYSRFDGIVSTTNSIAALAALGSMVLVALWIRDGGDPSSAALIPVIILALPTLFEHASALTAVRVQFELADTSAKRLLEYDANLTGESAGAPAREPRTAEPERIVLDEVTYRHGQGHGGVSGASTELAPRRWTAVIGSAGAGKSTMINLVLGRLTPQRGAVRYGDRVVAELTPDERAAIFSFMPQKPALLAGSIHENVLFGRDAMELSDDDRAMIERTGVGRIARQKAFALVPSQHAASAMNEHIEALRKRARERLASAGLTIHPFESGGADERDWLVERIVDAKLDRDRTLRMLLDDRRTILASLVRTSLGEALVAVGHDVIVETRRLLELPTHQEYARLAPDVLDERVWQLRRTAGDPATLVGIGLTATVREVERWKTIEARLKESAADAKAVREALASAVLSFDPRSIETHLDWKDNLVFGTVAVTNSRAAGEADRILLEVAADSPARDLMTDDGLAFAIGPGGEGLSGGQRQLVALCRTLLRRAPVVVLDEPTSALDPASKSSVADLLEELARDRLVITISHDTDLIERAHERRTIRDGRIVPPEAP